MSPPPVRLASLEIRDVTAVQRSLLAALDAFDGTGAFEVDLGAVAAADTAGVQLLLALKTECRQRRRALAFRGTSPALEHTLRLLGLSAALAPEG